MGQQTHLSLPVAPLHRQDSFHLLIFKPVCVHMPFGLAEDSLLATLKTPRRQDSLDSFAVLPGCSTSCSWRESFVKKEVKM
jgi:hypothetical protein